MLRLRSLVSGALAVVALGTSSLDAQQIVAFGSAEASGFGQSVGMLGASIGSGRNGWSPVASVLGLAFNYTDATGTDVTQTTIAPALGIRYTVPGQAWELQVGRSFTSDDRPAVIGAPAETQEGTFTTAQWNYWGTGERISSLIANYNWDAEYLWARGRSGWRLGMSPFLAGGEIIAQGTTASPAPAVGTRFELRAGPTLMWRLTPSFRLDGTAGLRTSTDFDRQSGYARIDFTWVSPLLGR